MSKGTRNPLFAVLGFLYLLIGMFYSPAGFLLDEVRRKASANSYFDHVLSVVSSHIDAQGDLRVCVNGIYDLQERQYWIRVPFQSIAHEPESIDKIDGYESFWRDVTTERMWHLPRQVIEPVSCTGSFDKPVQPVEVRKLKAAMEGGFETLDIIDRTILAESLGERVFELEVNDGAGEPLDRRQLAYSNPELEFGLRKKQSFTFSTGSFSKQGNKNWLWLLPVAWLCDVLTWPIQLWMWSAYADAH